MTTLPVDKDPRHLRGVDITAHEAFRAFEAVHRRASLIDEPISVASADPTSPAKFRQEFDRIRAVVSLSLVPDIEHIGSTSVPGLDGKPVIDIMVGLSDPERISQVVPALEKLHYESLGEAGVPGRWALRLREFGSHFNISIVARDGARWRLNLAIRDFLRCDQDAANGYGAAKWAAIARGATTLFAYSDHKRAAIETIATAAQERFPIPVASHVDLVEPSLKCLPAYTAALETGWSPDTTRVTGAKVVAVSAVGCWRGSGWQAAGRRRLGG